jgi:uncharacterized protein YdeI (BOF family)
MPVKPWFAYGAVFVAGALVVGGVWTVVAQTSNHQVAASSPGVVTGPTGDDQQDTSLSSDGVTPIAEVSRNQMVTIVGEVERVTDDDEFLLTDNSGSIKVWTGSTLFAVQLGEVVRVTGFVDNDLLIEVYATEIVYESGETIRISGYNST